MSPRARVTAYLKAHPAEVEALREELCLPLAPIEARCSLPEDHEHRQHAMGHALADHLASAGRLDEALALIARKTNRRR